MPIDSNLLSGAFGTVLGTILGLLASEFTEWRRKKHEKFEKRKEQTDQIIENALNFLFGADDVLREVMMNKALFLVAKVHGSSEAKALEDKIHRSFDARMEENFFPRLFFQSAQLKRLDDQTIWTEFEKLMTTQYELIMQAMKEENSKNYETLGSQYHGLYKTFVDRCIKTTKI